MALVKTPPGPKGRFLLGNTLEYMADPLDFLTRSAREHGDLVKLRLGPWTYYALNHPALAEQALRAHAAVEIKDKMTRMVRPILGDGLVTSEGEFWQRQRKLIMPAFQRGAIDRYATVMVGHAEELGRSWEDGRAVDIHDEMMSLTMGIVGKTLFDAEVGAEAHDVGLCLAVMTKHFLTPWKFLKAREWLPTRENRDFRAAVARLDEVVYGIIRHRRQSSEDPGDLLSHLLAAQHDDGSGMTDEHLRDECVTLFLAGHETTALTLTFAFLLLAHHPEAEEKLAREVAEVLEGLPPTAADVPRLRFADWVIKESLRLYPPGWAIGRQAVEDFEIGGYPVAKGTQLLISPWVLHRDPRSFEDPDAFRPERWDNDLARHLPKGTYIPFGDGPRICIGHHFATMEAILLLTTVIQRHRLESSPGEVLELTASITLRPRSGTRMIVRARDQANCP